MSVRSHALRPAFASGHLRMPSWSAIGDAVAKVVLWPVWVIVRIQARVIERDTIARMDDRMLRDIGVNRADTWVEAEGPTWR